jgi:hypothetical protein
VDRTYVGNQALAALGEPKVDSFEAAPDALSAAAKKVNRHLDAARDAVLERYGWATCTAWATIEASTAAGNWKFAKVFFMPGDFVKGLSIEGNCHAIFGEWVDPDTGNPRDAVFTNDIGPLNVTYVRRLPWAGFKQYLADAIGLEAAVRACFDVTGSMERQKGLADSERAAEIRAMGMDGGTEINPDEDLPQVTHILRRSAL